MKMAMCHANKAHRHLNISGLCCCLFSSFCCGSFLSSCLFGRCVCSFLGSLGSSDFGLLLSHSFCLCCVLGFFSFQTLFNSQFFLRSHRSLHCVDSLLLFSFPGIETLLSLSFIESAFFNTTLKVFHQQHTFVRKDAAYSVGGLSTNVNPIQSALEVKSNCSRISVRIIGTYPFNKSTISWCPAIGDNNRIERIVLTTMTLQSNFCCHLKRLISGL